MRYLIKYRCSGVRRYALVASYDTLAPVRDVQFTIQALDALSYATRAQAQRSAADLNAAFVRPGRRARFTAVPQDFNTAEREARRRAYRPRKLATLTPAQRGRMMAEVAAAKTRAAEAGVALPQFAVYATTNARSCRGGRAADGSYFIALGAYVIDDARPGFLTQVVSHEVAHVADVYARGTTDHSVTFYQLFRRLCPLEFQAYELTYKFGAAYAAGVRLADAQPQVRHYVSTRLSGKL